MLHKLPCIDNMNMVRAICNLRYKCQSAGTEQREVSSLGLCYTDCCCVIESLYQTKYCWKKFFFFVYVLAVLGHSKILGTTKDYSFAFCIHFVGRCYENSITKNCNSVLYIINTRLHLMFLHFRDVCYLHTLELWRSVFYIHTAKVVESISQRRVFWIWKYNLNIIQVDCF